MTSAVAVPRAKAAGLGWLALCGVLAPGCSEPYVPDPQFWPGSSGAGGAGGSGAVQSGDGGLGGTTATMTGGTLGASGTPPTTGGTDAGGNGATGGASNVAGSDTGSGGAENGGSAGMGSGGSGGSGGIFGNGGSAGRPGSGGSGGGAGMFGNGGSAGAASAANGGRAGTGGSSAGNGASAGSGGTMASANCSLTVKVTTASAGGRYAPRNIGAIWLADKSGNFIRSLEVWAQQRAGNLTLWNSATSKAGAAGSRVDIVSQATLNSHTTHTSTWNCQDFKKLPVPDGTYRVYFEMTDDNKAGPNRFEEFSKAAASATLKPTDSTNFKSIELSFKP